MVLHKNSSFRRDQGVGQQVLSAASGMSRTSKSESPSESAAFALRLLAAAAAFFAGLALLGLAAPFDLLAGDLAGDLCEQGMLACAACVDTPLALAYSQ